jgi:hypothetical protein
MNTLEKLREMAAQRPARETAPAAATATTTRHRAIADQIIHCGAVRRAEIQPTPKLTGLALEICRAAAKARGEKFDG